MGNFFIFWIIMINNGYSNDYNEMVHIILIKKKKPDSEEFISIFILRTRSYFFDFHWGDRDGLVSHQFQKSQMVYDSFIPLYIN